MEEPTISLETMGVCSLSPWILFEDVVVFSNTLLDLGLGKPMGSRPRKSSVGRRPKRVGCAKSGKVPTDTRLVSELGCSTLGEYCPRKLAGRGFLELISVVGSIGQSLLWERKRLRGRPRLSPST
jgi:hypothetical protein